VEHSLQEGRGSLPVLVWPWSQVLQQVTRAAEASCRDRADARADAELAGWEPVSRAEEAAAARGRAWRTAGGSGAGHVARRGQSGSPRLPSSIPTPQVHSLLES